MLVENQIIEERWENYNKDYYEKLGYKYAGKGERFLVPVEHLPISSRRKIKVICDCCGNEYEITFSSYNKNISEHGMFICDICLEKEKEAEKISEKQNELYKVAQDYCDRNGYTLVSHKEEFINMQSVAKFICPKHGLQEKKLTNMQQNKKCKMCANEIRGEKSKEYWLSNLNDRQEYYYDLCVNICNEKGYEFKTEKKDIVGRKCYIEFICPEHGAHKMRLGNFLSGERCPKCGEKIVGNHRGNKGDAYRLDVNEVSNRIESCGGVLLNPEDYVNTSTKNLKIICPVCGKPFITSLRCFTQHGGQSCQSCNRKVSVGERRIKDYLEKNSIEYEPEKWFTDCRDVNPLPFDFYLPKNNCIIEFDGEQHFKEKHFFNNVTTGHIQNHDAIKTQYCIDNNIDLIRIPYTQINNIEKILSEKLIA